MDITTAIGLGLFVAGLAVGTLSGMLGIGGGVLIIPILMIVFGFNQKIATGTSLGMLLPPIGIFAVLTYYRAGQINITAALILAVAFAVGAWIGSLAVTHGYVADAPLRKFFAFFTLYVAGNMLFHSDHLTWATFKTVLIMAIGGLTYVLLRLVGKRWQHTYKLGEVFRKQASRPMAMDYEI